MKRFALSFLTAVLLASCGVAETITEMNEQASRTADELEGSLGTRPHIGWNVNNGTLTYVNVYFENIDDRSVSVAELSDQVKTAVAETIEQTPAELVVSVAIATN
jgi:hypothetical protein